VERLWWLLNGGERSESLLERSERDVGISFVGMSGAGRELVYEDMRSSSDLGGYGKDRCEKICPLYQDNGEGRESRNT